MPKKSLHEQSVDVFGTGDNVTKTTINCNAKEIADFFRTKGKEPEKKEQTVEQFVKSPEGRAIAVLLEVAEDAARYTAEQRISACEAILKK